MLHPQHGKALHHGGNLLSDGNYDEVDAKGKPRYAKTGNTKDAYMELDFGRDFHISKVLIFNLLSSPESLIGTVLVLTNEKNKVVFVCPISTSMKLYQIRPIPRAKVDNPYPIQPVVQQPTNDVIDLKLPLREDEKKMGKTCCSWLMSVCCCCCIPAVGIPLDVTKQDTPTKKRQSVDPIPSPPRSPRDKITLPLEWSAAIVGDYEVCPAAKQKYFGYEGDVYEGYQRNEAEGEGMGIWENL